MRAVRELGLGGYTNTSYPLALAALIDDAAGALRRDRRSAPIPSSSTSANATLTGSGEPSSTVRS